MIQKIRNNWIPLALFGASTAYYYALSSKIFTWIYTSGDAGDWLGLLHQWYVPHTFGKPLIVLYIRFLSIFPGDDVIKLTVGMSVIPAAVTVMLVYLIVHRLTNSVRYSIVAACGLLGATIFLTQATVLEQYTFTAMFITAAFYFHIQDKKKMVAIMLGLATATHMMGAIFTFIWFIVNWKDRKEWLRVAWIWVICGVLPYMLIFYMMANPMFPKVVAGGLSWGSLNVYAGNPTGTAALALTEGLKRLKEFAMVASISIGLAIVPIVRGLRPLDRLGKLSVVLMVFMGWFYMTNMFPSVWKWLSFVLPIAFVYAGIGLSKLPQWHSRVVLIGASVLIIVNSMFFDADQIARADPQATEYVEKLRGIPEGSAVVIPRGGPYGFATLYVMYQGKDIIPIAQSSPMVGIRHEYSELPDTAYGDYLKWLKSNYDIEGQNMYEVTQFAMDEGYDVYYAQPLTEIWSEVFTVEKNRSGILQKVKAVNADANLSRWVPEE